MGRSLIMYKDPHLPLTSTLHLLIRYRTIAVYPNLQARRSRLLSGENHDKQRKQVGNEPNMKH